ncbi:MAG: MazG-like family protein [Pigmentiphaga sp.]
MCVQPHAPPLPKSKSPEKLDAVGREITDVLLYLMQLSNMLGIDPIKAAQAKIPINAQKYPVSRAKGSRKTYDQL